MVKIRPALIAPCGFNCALCLANQKKENESGYCSGCNEIDGIRQKHCSKCVIKKCPIVNSNSSGFCYDCDKFPCLRLRQLDEKYIKGHNVSMIENLKFIQHNGMGEFLESENLRWSCKNCGEIICLHRRRCLNCGNPL